MSTPKQEEQKPELSPEEQEKLKRFEKVQAKKKKELLSVLTFLRDDLSMKMNKGIFN